MNRTTLVGGGCAGAAFLLCFIVGVWLRAPRVNLEPFEQKMRELTAAAEKYRAESDKWKAETHKGLALIEKNIALIKKKDDYIAATNNVLKVRAELATFQIEEARAEGFKAGVKHMVEFVEKTTKEMK